jgi:hypothetical protein
VLDSDLRLSLAAALRHLAIEEGREGGARDRNRRAAAGCGEIGGGAEVGRLLHETRPVAEEARRARKG